jgi:hypothetical protein
MDANLHDVRVRSAAAVHAYPRSVSPGGLEGRMTGLQAAIARRDWEPAALYLTLAVMRAAARLPAGTAADLLALLEAGGQQRGGA